MPPTDFSDLRSTLRAARTVRVSGRVVRACGTMLQVRGLSAHIGELCRLSGDDAGQELFAEVVGLQDEDALLMPLGSLQGVSTRTRVETCGTSQTVRVDASVIGRVLDASGHPIDGGAALDCATLRTADRASPASAAPRAGHALLRDRRARHRHAAHRRRRSAPRNFRRGRRRQEHAARHAGAALRRRRQRDRTDRRARPRDPGVHRGQPAG